MATTASYDPQLSRVRIQATGLPAAGVTAQLERSPDGIRWSVVRGGLALELVSLDAGVTTQLRTPADDYEFAAGELNRYRLTAYDAGGVQLVQEAATITPELGSEPWLKVPARPFLNRPVIVLDYGELELASRGGVFDVIGRSFPVAVSDVRSSRRYELQLVTYSPDEARELELLFAAGEPVFLQGPPECDVPGGYFSVGNVGIARPSRKSVRRIFTLPLTEIAAPGPDVAGAASTWQTVRNTYPTWNDVISAHATWADLLELIGSPSDVIVQ